MHIETKSFEALSPNQLYEYLQLRSEVFVVEQECIYQDPDGKDENALHVLGYSEQGVLAACTRVLPPEGHGQHPCIGRVAVRNSYRGLGLGKRIMEATIQAIEAHFGIQKISLSAQTYLKDFYKELGFVEKGEQYLEDGIPHIWMERDPS